MSRSAPSTRACAAIFADGCVAPSPGPGPDPRTLDQPVGVAVTCVRDNLDGTYDAVFGYDNPNAHDVTLPVGALNTVSLSPGPAGSSNRGQPTTFGTPGVATAQRAISPRKGRPRDFSLRVGTPVTSQDTRQMKWSWKFLPTPGRA